MIRLFKIEGAYGEYLEAIESYKYENEGYFCTKKDLLSLLMAFREMSILRKGDNEVLELWLDNKVENK